MFYSHYFSKCFLVTFSSLLLELKCYEVSESLCIFVCLFIFSSWFIVWKFCWSVIMLTNSIFCHLFYWIFLVFLFLLFWLFYFSILNSDCVLFHNISLLWSSLFFICSREIIITCWHSFIIVVLKFLSDNFNALVFSVDCIFSFKLWLSFILHE